MSIYEAGSSLLLRVENPNVIACLLKILIVTPVYLVAVVHRRPAFVKSFDFAQVHMCCKH